MLLLAAAAAAAAGCCCCCCCRRYQLLRMLETEAKLTVFPYIEVEEKMENKVTARAADVLGSLR
jgi:hypothetical protein